MEEQPNKPEQDSAQSPNAASESDDPFATRFDMPPDAEVAEKSAPSSQANDLGDEHAAQPKPPPAPKPPATPPTASGTPVMSYIPGSIALGLVGKKEVKEVEISIRNSGQGLLTGQVLTAVNWLEVPGDNSIQCNPLEVKKYTVRLKANAPRTALSDSPLIKLTGNAGNMLPEGELVINGSYTPLPKPKEGIALIPDDTDFPVAMMEQMKQSVKLPLNVENYTQETAKIAIQVNKPWLKLNTSVVTLEPGQSVPLLVSATPAEIPELQQTGGSIGAMFRLVIEGKPELTIQRELTVTVQRTGITRMSRLTLWAMYLAVWLAGVFGLAAGMRILSAIMIERDVAFFPLLFGILGFFAPVGVVVAFSRVGVLKNAQTQIDQIEDYYNGEPLAGSIAVSRATNKWWHLGLVVLLTVTGGLGGWLAGSPSTRDAGIWLGIIGGLLVGVLGGISSTTQPTLRSGQRQFEFEQLYRPLAVGVGLTMWAAALKLVGGNSWDILLYMPLIVIGMVGIAGASMRAMPLRLHQWSGRLHVALMSGISAVAAMSLASMFLDGRSIEVSKFVDDHFEPVDETLRFAYSPAYFVSTASDRNIILASLFSIVLVTLGIVGAAVVMQAFGQNVVTDRRLGLRFGAFLAAGLTVVMIPMLVIWPIVAILPLGRTFEGWLIWGIPATILTALLITIRMRPTLMDKGMAILQQTISKMAFLPPFMRNPLNEFGALRAADIQPVVTWELGWVVVIVGSIVAAPLVLSFWFWVIVLVGFLFLADKTLAAA